MIPRKLLVQSISSPMMSGNGAPFQSISSPMMSGNGAPFQSISSPMMSGNGAPFQSISSPMMSGNGAPYMGMGMMNAPFQGMSSPMMAGNGAPIARMGMTTTIQTIPSPMMSGAPPMMSGSPYPRMGVPLTGTMMTLNKVTEDKIQPFSGAEAADLMSFNTVPILMMDAIMMNRPKVDISQGALRPFLADEEIWNKILSLLEVQEGDDYSSYDPEIAEAWTALAQIGSDIDTLKANLEGWTVEKLSKFLKAQGLSTAGDKENMVLRIVDQIPTEKLSSLLDKPMGQKNIQASLTAEATDSGRPMHPDPKEDDEPAQAVSSAQVEGTDTDKARPMHPASAADDAPVQAVSSAQEKGKETVEEAKPNDSASEEDSAAQDVSLIQEKKSITEEAKLMVSVPEEDSAAQDVSSMQNEKKIKSNVVILPLPPFPEATEEIEEVTSQPAVTTTKSSVFSRFANWLSSVFGASHPMPGAQFFTVTNPELAKGDHETEKLQTFYVKRQPSPSTTSPISTSSFPALAIVFAGALASVISVFIVQRRYSTVEQDSEQTQNLFNTLDPERFVRIEVAYGAV